ncbi:MAG: hypothetical protein Q9182_001487 [Xanthomendoza sp. 2 TL-2023]
MEWTGYDTNNRGPAIVDDFRRRRPRRMEAPPRPYENVAPSYLRPERAANYQDEYEVPLQYMPNPLAAYAVPPNLPRLSGPGAGRLPGRRTVNIRSFRRDDDLFLQTNYTDDLEPTVDDPGDDEPEDQPNLKLWLGENLVDTKVESSTPAQVHISTSKPPKEKPNPYNETIERIHHSRFGGDPSQPDNVVAQLTSAPEQFGSLSKETALFYWMDLQQVVCQLDYTPKRHCFHVPQLWCLVIDNRLLLTSGQLSSSEARQQIVHIGIETSCENSTRFLQVVNHHNRIWLLPLSDCESWTVSHSLVLAPTEINVLYKGFLAHFFYGLDEDFSDNYVVTYGRAAQGPKEWPNLIALAKRETVRLRVRSRGQRLRRRREFTRANSSPSSSEANSPSFDQTNKPSVNESLLTNLQPLSTDLEDMVADTSGTAQRMRFDAENARNPDDQNVTATLKPSEQTRRTVKVSRQSFHLFYWLAAAVSRQSELNTTEPGIMTASTDSDCEQIADSTSFEVDLTEVNPDAEGTITIHNQSYRRDFRRKFQKLAEHIQWGPAPKGVKLPEEVGDLWRHFVSIFVKGTSQSPRKVLSSEFEICRDLIKKSQTKLLKSVQPKTLESLEAALPNDIVSLLISKFSKDVTNDSPDIFTTYYEFLRNLEQDVQRRPYSRTHQEALSSFRQEITCILQVLEHQCNVVQQLQQSYDLRDFHHDDRFGPRREDVVLQECLFVLEDRISNFNSLEQHARDLTSFNLLRIESSKDRQEAAIVVFTVVTIIFLPLSFVSSFFGMNTTDIRDTKYPQWIFWATALPLTIAVVAIALFVAQKIEPVKDLWSRLSEKWDERHEARTGIYRQPTMHDQSRNQVRSVEAPDDPETGVGFRNTSPPPAPLPHPPPPPRSQPVEYQSGSRSAADLEHQERTSNSPSLRHR